MIVLKQNADFFPPATFVFPQYLRAWHRRFLMCMPHPNHIASALSPLYSSRIVRSFVCFLVLRMECLMSKRWRWWAEGGRYRNEPDSAPFSFVISFTQKATIHHLGEQENKAQRAYATCKGSHSTVGLEPTFSWFPGLCSLPLLQCTHSIGPGWAKTWST